MRTKILFFSFAVFFLLFSPFAKANTVNVNASASLPPYCGDGICNAGETCSNCPQDCGICPSPPGGPGPSISLPPPNVSVSPYNISITLTNLTSFIPVYVEIPQEKNLSLVVIIVETTKNVSRFTLTIERFLEKPSFINASSEKDYTYLNLSADSPDIFRLKFKFRIEKPWFAEKNITNVSQMIMYRLGENVWEELFTTHIYEDSDYHYYYSECRGLSIFSIGLLKEEFVLPPPPSCPVCPPDTSWSACVNGKQSRTIYKCGNETGYECLAFVEERDCEVFRAVDYTRLYTIVGLILIVSALVLGIYFVRRQKLALPAKKPPKPAVIVPKVEIIPKLAPQSIEEVVDKAKVGDTVLIRAELSPHAIGVPNIYKLEDKTAIIYGTSLELIDKGFYDIKATVNEEDGRKYLEIKEVKHV